MEPAAVLFVDDDEDLREVMPDILVRIGVQRVIAASSLSHVQAVRDEALACQVAILDINLGAGEPTGVAVFEWLEREGFAGRIVFLTGHASSDARVKEAASIVGATVVAKPLSVNDLRTLLDATTPAV